MDGVIRAKNEANAIRTLNTSDHGPASAVFTRNAARGLRVAHQIHSGRCHMIGATVHDEPQMPCGGMAGSSYGHFGGKAGIDPCIELRWITIESLPCQFPI